MWFCSAYLFPFKLPFHYSTIFIHLSSRWLTIGPPEAAVLPGHIVTRSRNHESKRYTYPSLQIIHTLEPRYSATVCYRNLWRYIDGGGKSKYCTIGNFPSLHILVYGYTKCSILPHPLRNCSYSSRKARMLVKTTKDRFKPQTKVLTKILSYLMKPAT
jgi:hypothetical protein